jgi:hypothetical protein
MEHTISARAQSFHDAVCIESKKVQLSARVSGAGNEIQHLTSATSLTHKCTRLSAASDEVIQSGQSILLGQMLEMCM